eukprot:SAG31_NODE_2580_length_5438_cov_8.500843_7_plen_197_part_00
MASMLPSASWFAGVRPLVLAPQLFVRRSCPLLQAMAAMQERERTEWESDCNAQFESQFPRDLTAHGFGGLVLDDQHAESVQQYAADFTTIEREASDEKHAVVRAQAAQDCETNKEDSFETQPKLGKSVATDWDVVDSSNTEDACTESIPAVDRSNVVSRPQIRKRSNRLGERLLKAKQAKTAGDKSDGHACTKTLL